MAFKKKECAVIVKITQVVDGVVTNETRTVEGCGDWDEVNYKANQFMGGVMTAAQTMIEEAQMEAPGAKKPWQK